MVLRPSRALTESQSVGLGDVRLACSVPLGPTAAVKIREENGRFQEQRTYPAWQHPNNSRG